MFSHLTAPFPAGPDPLSAWEPVSPFASPLLDRFYAVRALAHARKNPGRGEVPMRLLFSRSKILYSAKKLKLDCVFISARKAALLCAPDGDHALLAIPIEGQKDIWGIWPSDLRLDPAANWRDKTGQRAAWIEEAANNLVSIDKRLRCHYDSAPDLFVPACPAPTIHQSLLNPQSRVDSSFMQVESFLSFFPPPDQASGFWAIDGIYPDTTGWRAPRAFMPLHQSQHELEWACKAARLWDLTWDLFCQGYTPGQLVGYSQDVKRRKAARLFTIPLRKPRMPFSAHQHLALRHKLPAEAQALLAQ